MEIDKVIVSTFRTNCYFIYEKNYGAIIDPGGNCNIIIKKIKELNFINFIYIINTHGHSDHTFCNKILKELLNLKILIHEKDAFFLNSNSVNKIYSKDFKEVTPDILLKDNDFIDLFSIKLKVIHTEGHTPGSIMLITDNIIFSGDTIFRNSIGRTDFEYGNSKKMKESIIKILDYFQDDYKIYPGHGEPTTLNNERGNLLYFLDLL